VATKTHILDLAENAQATRQQPSCTSSRLLLEQPTADDHAKQAEHLLLHLSQSSDDDYVNHPALTNELQQSGLVTQNMVKTPKHFTVYTHTDIHTYIPYHNVTLRYVTLLYITLRYITLHIYIHISQWGLNPIRGIHPNMKVNASAAGTNKTYWDAACQLVGDPAFPC